MTIEPTSMLFITLDSCRYDTFEATDAPNIKGLGILYRAMAPGSFTFSSHAAMFVGFTPGLAEAREPFINPKFAKIFKIVGAGFTGKGNEFVTLSGKNIIDGLKRLGYAAIGTGSVGWFDPATPTGRILGADFDEFWFSGSTSALASQLAFVDDAIERHRDQPVFVFINVGETHVPYYFDGADWDETNPCVPFASDNDAQECRKRQSGCLEYVDRTLGPLLTRFEKANVIVCADHGDAWGEDGIWEHGVHHPKVMEVPLVFRLQNPPVIHEP